MITVAIDAMGSDDGARVCIEGAAALSREDADIHAIVVGDVPTLSAALAEQRYDPAGITLVHAGDHVRMDEHPRAAIERRECSITVATRLVKDGDADALVTAGHTGAAILAASELLHMLPGVRRAALATVYPTEARHGPRGDPFALILDVGATVKAGPEDLMGFASMGAAYSSIISEIRSPRVALLSNGTEPTKGTDAIVEAHRRLKDGPLNFAGNIEGLDIPKGTVDVVVTDGFIGNVVLKMLEGISEVVVDMAREAAAKHVRWRLALSMLGGGLAELRKLTDFNQYGGAPLLGFDQVIIKAHGRSSGRAIRNAVKVAAKARRGDLTGRIRDHVAALRLSETS